MDSDLEIFEIPPLCYLKDVTKNSNGKCHYLKPPKVVIGRSQLAEIPLYSKNVSRNHATLNHTKGGWQITDNKSINGVYVDNIKLKPDKPQLLKYGQIISLGPSDVSTFQFEFYSPKPVTKEVTIIDSSSTDMAEASSSSTCPNMKKNTRNILKRDDKCDRALEVVDLHNEVPIFKKTRTVSHSDVEVLSANTATFSGLDFLSEVTPISSATGSQVESEVRELSSTKTTCSGAESEYQEVPSTKTKCVELELSLNERLDAMKTMMVNFDAIDKRIQTILNQSDEQLNNNQENTEGDIDSSPSLLAEEHDPIFHSDDHLWFVPEVMMDSEEQEQPGASSVWNKKSQIDSDELKDLKEKCDELKKRMKEQEQLLREELEKKDAIIEQQNQEKKLLQEEGSRALNTGKTFEQSVKDEVGKEFGSLMEAELTCVICTEMFVKAVNLECSHTFCLKCLTTWKLTKNECPICRAPITKETRSLVTDNLIDKMIEKLSPEFQERRKTVLKEHEIPKSKPPARQPRTRRQNTRRGRARQNNSHFLPAPALLYNITSNILSPMLSLVNNTTGSSDVREADTSDHYDYYAGYGRCYNCGLPGHWANGCPELY